MRSNTNNLIQFYEDQLTQHNLKYLPYADTQLECEWFYFRRTPIFLLCSIFKTPSTVTRIRSRTQNVRSPSTQSLAKLRAGADALDIASSQLSLKQRKYAYGARKTRRLLCACAF